MANISKSVKLGVFTLAIMNVTAVVSLRGLPAEAEYGLSSAFYYLFAAIVFLIYNPQIQISAESETKRSIFREKDKTKRSKKESAQHSKSRNKSFVMTSVSAL